MSPAQPWLLAHFSWYLIFLLVFSPFPHQHTLEQPTIEVAYAHKTTAGFTRRRPTVPQNGLPANNRFSIFNVLSV